MTRRLALIVLVGLFGSGCSHYSCANMGFTSFEKADRIVVKQMSKTTLMTITDRSRISQITRFVEARGNGWSVPFGGTPIGSVSLEFYSGAQFLGDFGVGRGFAEAQGCGYFLSRHLAADERRELSRLIGISDDVIE